MKKGGKRMKVKIFLKKLLRYVLIFITFVIVAQMLDIFYKDTISYTKALQIVKEDEASIKKIAIDDKKK